MDEGGANLLVEYIGSRGCGELCMHRSGVRWDPPFEMTEGPPLEVTLGPTLVMVAGKNLEVGLGPHVGHDVVSLLVTGRKELVGPKLEWEWE